MEKIKRGDVWLADLNPRLGTEAGKRRPVVVIQTDLLNDAHPSTIICHITTNITPGSEILRVHLSAGEAGLEKSSDIMIDQIRAIDNKRILKKLGSIKRVSKEKLNENLGFVLDLEEE